MTLICHWMVWMALLAAGQAGASAPVRFVTSEFPPYVMQGTPPAGALYELVEEVARRAHTPGQIEFTPWKRAVFLAASAPRTAVFPLTRTPERERQYRWLVRLYHEQYVFMTTRNGLFDVADPARSKQRRIAIIRGSGLIPQVRAMGYQNIVETRSVEESLRFVTRGMVDAVFGDRNVVRSMLHGLPGDDYRVSAPVRSVTTWLGGSLDIDETEAARFQQAMKEMVSDGAYSQILKKYKLAPPP